MIFSDEDIHQPWQRREVTLADRHSSDMASKGLTVTRSDKRGTKVRGKMKKTLPRGHFINVLFLIVSHCRASVLS